jgi:hypothetical protein
VDEKTTGDGLAVAERTAEDTTVAELMETIAPPRDGTTGVHLTAVGPDYLLAIQGPESLHLARLILDFVEALYAEVERKRTGA